jgi:hypothetical protein
MAVIQCGFMFIVLAAINQRGPGRPTHHIYFGWLVRYLIAVVTCKKEQPRNLTALQKADIVIFRY